MNTAAQGARNIFIGKNAKNKKQLVMFCIFPIFC